MDRPLSKKREINWIKVLFQLQINSSAIFTIGYLIRYGCMYRTGFFAILLVGLGIIGQFAGAHRLWAHHSYKATTGLKIFLMICQTLVGHFVVLVNDLTPLAKTLKKIIGCPVSVLPHVKLHTLFRASVGHTCYYSQLIYAINYFCIASSLLVIGINAHPIGLMNNSGDVLKGTIYDWVVWHRLHHKHLKTDLDPYNNKNGFFYSHVVSLVRDLSPAQIEAVKELDVSDLENDKVVMFQKKWYNFLYILLVPLLPINTPCEFWGESILTSLMIAGWFRYALTLHFTWLIHSAISIWDLKAGEKFPADTNLVFLITKTYWISYHYLAPWDYQTSELGKYGTDCITRFIKVCQALDYASDLKVLDSDSVRAALSKSVSENINVNKCLAEYEDIDKLKTVRNVAPKLCC